MSTSKWFSKDSLSREIVKSFFNTFVIFLLSFLTIGLLGFIAEIPCTQSISPPEAWNMVFNEIYFFSKWLIPSLLLIFTITEYASSVYLCNLVQKIALILLFDAIALISGAFLGINSLNTIQIGSYKLDNGFYLFAISSIFYIILVMLFTKITYSIKHDTQARQLLKLEL
jgi:hypothetical protein